MRKSALVVLGAGALTLSAGVPLMAATAAIGAMAGSTLAPVLGPAPAMAPALPAPTAAAAGSALARVPLAMLELYEQAAATCPGLSWTVLAAIGTVESDNGRSALPGVHSGRNSAGAEGPMQFEPATFARYEQPVPPGGASPPSPYDPADAVYAAARMLCADGAGGAGDAGRSPASAAHVRGAILAYNHSSAYADEVLRLAQVLAAEAGPSPTPGVAGELAVAFAMSQIGTPYRWGGETPGVGFDCSGLAQAAWASAGVAIPRVAQQQFDAGPAVPPTQPLAPGDLVFFASTSGAVSHVGLYVGTADGRAFMVDAPDSRVVVRVEAFPTAVGQAWGGEVFAGATDPGRSSVAGHG
jgi:cell wall-associated NlpC family hydrolase